MASLVGGLPRNLSTLFSAFADQMAPLTHAAPYREPRKYEARYRRNNNAGGRVSHRSHTKLQAVYPPVLGIVWHTMIVCQSEPLDGAEFCNCLNVFDVVDGLQVVLKVAVLLWTDVRPGPHRLPAHRASGPASGDDCRGFGAQVPRLFSRHAASERRVALLLAIEIVRD